MTGTQPTPNGNERSVTPALTPPNRWVRLAFTFIPFFIYMLAERVPLPTLEHLEYAKNSPEAYSVVVLGIMPWIIAAVIVGIVAAILPNSWNIREKRVFGGTYVSWATNVVGFHIAAWQAVVKVSRLEFGGVFDPLVSADSPHADLLGLRPYATSPGLVFIALMAGAIFVRLLAEVVTRYGLVNGYVAFFTGELSLFIFRKFFRRHLSPEWFNTLDLVGCVIMCLALILIVAKLRPARNAMR